MEISRLARTPFWAAGPSGVSRFSFEPGAPPAITLLSILPFTWVSPFLADRDRTAERAEGVPVEGCEAVWRVSSHSDRWHAYLCRRGNTWLTLEFTDDFTSDPLPAALAWLEGWTAETT